MFKSYSLKQPTRSDSEDSSDEDSIAHVNDITVGMSNMNVNSRKVYNQKDNLIHNVQELRERVDQIRKGWFDGGSNRQNKGYSPSEHDKIKFNINLYLGQCLQFFVKNSSTTTAIVLDSEDLGSSATLAAFGLQPSHIYVPNYWKGGTEYTSMKYHLPELACFPISLEGFITALGESENTATFRKHLNDKYKATKYYHRMHTEEEVKRLEKAARVANPKAKVANRPIKDKHPKLKKDLPTYVKHLDFAYLDYCGKFMNTGKKSTNNSETVDTMFQQEMFPTDSSFVLAITGSLMRTFKAKYDYELQQYKDAVIASASSAGYKIREDQFFIYRRSHQEGGVIESLAHNEIDFDDIPEGIHLKEQSNASTMFFMSFIGNASTQKLKEWDELFDQQCDGGNCKLQFAHRECLYQRGKDRLHLSKPFCNYRVMDWYLVDPTFQDYTSTIRKFDKVPMYGEDRSADAVYLSTWKQKLDQLPDQLFKAFNIAGTRRTGRIIEIVDMTEVIRQVNQARDGQNSSGLEVTYKGRTFKLDSIHHIYSDKIFKGKVSIECILGDIVGLHFTESANIDIPGIDNMRETAFLVQIGDFYNMLDEPGSDSDSDLVPRNNQHAFIFSSDDDSDSESDLVPINNRHDFLASDNGLTTHKRVSKQKHKRAAKQKHKRAAKQIRHPFKECKKGYVYSDQDGDNIYYLSDGRVDVYDSFFVPLDNNFMTRQQFASVNKDAILSEIGQYSEKDVYHKPEQGDNIRYLFEDDDGNNWHKGVILRVDSGEYTVYYDSDAEPYEHELGAFSKDNFNKHWKFAK